MIKTSEQLENEVIERRIHGTLTRAAAIRLHCLDCVGFKSKEVERCNRIACPLWGYRDEKTEEPGEPPF